MVLDKSFWRNDFFQDERARHYPMCFLLLTTDVSPTTSTLANNLVSPHRSIVFPAGRAREFLVIQHFTKNKTASRALEAPAQDDGSVSGMQVYFPFWTGLLRPFGDLIVGSLTYQALEVKLELALSRACGTALRTGCRMSVLHLDDNDVLEKAELALNQPFRYLHSRLANDVSLHVAKPGYALFGAAIVRRCQGIRLELYAPMRLWLHMHPPVANLPGRLSLASTPRRNASPASSCQTLPLVFRGNGLQSNLHGQSTSSWKKQRTPNSTGPVEAAGPLRCLTDAPWLNRTAVPALGDIPDRANACPVGADIDLRKNRVTADSAPCGTIHLESCMLQSYVVLTTFNASSHFLHPSIPR